jgi:dephospho-CoA kinase
MRKKNKNKNSKNPNITFEMIRNNINKSWDSNNLSLNTFTLEKEMFFRKKLSEWFKKSDLKRELIANLWHPKKYEKFKYYDPEMFLEEDVEEK